MHSRPASHGFSILLAMEIPIAIAVMLISLIPLPVSGQSIPPILSPLFSSRHEIPDSLVRSDDGLGLYPNPFPVRFTVKNISHQTGGIRRIILLYPRTDGLRLNPASTYPEDFDPKLTLAPGESKTWEWFIDVETRPTRRNVMIQMYAYDDEGNPIWCDDRLPIAAVCGKIIAWKLEGGCTIDVDTMAFDKPRARYDSDTFVVSGSVWNAGSLDLRDITTRISWLNPLDEHGQEMDLVELDPDAPDNGSFRVRDFLQTGDTIRYAWKFRLKNWNRTWSMKYMRFYLEGGTGQTSYETISGESRVYIAPTNILTEMDDGTSAEDRSVPRGQAPVDCTLRTIHPNPVVSTAVVAMHLSRAMRVSLTLLDILGRPVRRVIDGQWLSAGSHSARISAAGLPVGMYVLRLTSGDEVQTGRMVIAAH